VPGITVRGLLELPRLGMTVRAGADGLDAPVRWAHVSELQDPTPFLEGGELVLATGFGISRRVMGQVEYLQRLYERGVAGIAIARSPQMRPWTRGALKEADRLGFPVLEMPFEVSYVDIARLVAAANEQGSHQRVVRHLQIFEMLQEYQSTTVPLADFVRRLSQVSGFALYASSPAGTEILPGLPPPPDHIDPVSDSPVVPGGYCIPVVVGGRVAARLTALRRDDDFPSGLAAAQNLATVIGIPMRDLYQRREAERREGAEVLASLMSGVRSGANGVAKLVERGFEPMRDVVVTVVRSREKDFDDAEIHHRLCDRLLPSMLVTRGDLVIVVPDVEEAMVAIEQVDFDVEIGVSTPFALGADLTVPWRQARWSLERAVAGGQRLARFTFEDAASDWLPLDATQLKGVVDDILGAVVSYDREHDAQLVESLRILFRHDRRMNDAAADLGIHKHTLAYRMRNVERLSGRKLGELHGLVDLWLAMKALSILSDEQGAPSL
jgi:PucR family transcriptional regulator, purine catabolism regulatory protein